MAEIDERLVPVIDALLRSPLAPLGRSAIERIDTVEDAPAADEEDQDPFRPREGEDDDERAHRQLRILDEVVGGTLKLEISLFDANERLAGEIAAGAAGREGETFKTVMVIEANDDSHADDAGRINLLTGARREQLLHTLQRWKSVVEATSRSIDGPEVR